MSARGTAAEWKPMILPSIVLLFLVHCRIYEPVWAQPAGHSHLRLSLPPILSDHLGIPNVGLLPTCIRLAACRALRRHSLIANAISGPMLCRLD